MHNRKHADKKNSRASHYSTELLVQSMALLALFWALFWRLLRVLNIVSAPNQQLQSLPRTKLDSDTPHTPPQTSKHRQRNVHQSEHSAPVNNLQLGPVLPTFSLLKYSTARHFAHRSALDALLVQENDDSKKKSGCTNKNLN